jgi:hypothetical protein
MRRPEGIMGIELPFASPALRAGEVEGARAPRVKAIGSARGAFILRGDPITLTLVASRLDLSREAGEVS